MRADLAAILAAAALAVCSPGQAAPSWRDFPAVANTSFTDPAGGRVLQLWIRVHAEPEAVWAVLSTAEGWKSWSVPFAVVDFRVGGIIETSYSAAAKAGDPANIKNEIQAYVPNRLLVIRNVQAPPGFRDAEAFARTATVIELRPYGAGSTLVTLSAMGYGQGEAFDRLYAKFELGDAYTLEELRTRFNHGPVNWAKRRGQ